MSYMPGREAPVQDLSHMQGQWPRDAGDFCGVRRAGLEVIVAAPAQPGLWCDFSQFPTRDQAMALKAYGFVGCGTYVALPGMSGEHDINAERLLMLTEDVGLQVVLFQHCRFPGWDPRSHSGAVDGAAAAAYALAAGYPLGAHLYVDWEGMIAGLTAAAGKVFLESWADRLLKAGLRAGMYCGYDDPLSASDRYGLHGIDTYATDAGNRIVAVRGCAFHQGPEMTVAGVNVDSDKLAPDELGDVPWVASAGGEQDAA